MTNQSFEDASSPDFSEHEARNKKFRDATGEAFSKASENSERPETPFPKPPTLRAMRPRKLKEPQVMRPRACPTMSWAF